MNFKHAKGAGRIGYMYWEHQLVNCAFVFCLNDVMFVFSIVKQVCIEFHYVFFRVLASHRVFSQPINREYVQALTNGSGPFVYTFLNV